MIVITCAISSIDTSFPTGKHGKTPLICYKDFVWEL